MEALLSDERFSNFFDGLHANLADDYPETQKAIEAAGINLDRNKYRKPDTPQAVEPTDAPPPTAAPKPTPKRARTKSTDPRAVVAKFNADWAAGKVDTLEAWAAREGIAYKTLSRYRAEVNGETGLQD